MQSKVIVIYRNKAYLTFLKLLSYSRLRASALLQCQRRAEIMRIYVDAEGLKVREGEKGTHVAGNRQCLGSDVDAVVQKELAKQSILQEKKP